MNKLLELVDRMHLRRIRNRRKKFDLVTTGINAQGNPFVWYQNYPALMGLRHHVNGVNYFIHVNPDEPPLKVPSEFFHCVDCKLMGTRKTFKEYKCMSLQV